jgi:NAD+ diphosphatase
MTAHPHPPHRSQPALARSGLDRAAGERSDEAVAAARADAGTRVLIVRGDRAPLEEGQTSLRFVAPVDVPEGAQWAFLGRSDGVSVLCAAFPADAEDPIDAAGGWGGLRAVGGALDAADAGVFVQAVSLGRWLVDSSYCPSCGGVAALAGGGWSRRCTVCAREHFPRTDPAVIVAVESEDRSRLLLGSNALWGQDRYSCFAGFVEAGESLEAAVEREIQEESGIRVASVEYRGSQAWPYPRSLMVGFRAQAARDTDARPDGDEIVSVRWFSRAELSAAFDGRSEVLLPGAASIAHTLIRDWTADGDPSR